MVSDSIFSLRIGNPRSEQSCKNHGMKRYTFPTVVCQSGVGKSR